MNLRKTNQPEANKTNSNLNETHSNLNEANTTCESFYSELVRVPAVDIHRGDSLTQAMEEFIEILEGTKKSNSNNTPYAVASNNTTYAEATVTIQPSITDQTVNHNDSVIKPITIFSNHKKHNIPLLDPGTKRFKPLAGQIQPVTEQIKPVPQQIKPLAQQIKPVQIPTINSTTLSDDFKRLQATTIGGFIETIRNTKSMNGAAIQLKVTQLNFNVYLGRCSKNFLLVNYDDLSRMSNKAVREVFGENYQNIYFDYNVADPTEVLKLRPIAFLHYAVLKSIHYGSGTSKLNFLLGIFSEPSMKSFFHDEYGASIEFLQYASPQEISELLKENTQISSNNETVIDRYQQPLTRETWQKIKNYIEKKLKNKANRAPLQQADQIEPAPIQPAQIQLDHIPFVELEPAQVQQAQVQLDHIPFGELEPAQVQENQIQPLPMQAVQVQQAQLSNNSSLPTDSNSNLPLDVQLLPASHQTSEQQSFSNTQPKIVFIPNNFFNNIKQFDFEVDKLINMPFGVILNAIQKNPNMNTAGKELGVPLYALNRYLGRCCTDRLYLDYVYLKQVTQEECVSIWGEDFDKKPLMYNSQASSLNSLATRSTYVLHQAILQCVNPQEGTSVLHDLLGLGPNRDILGYFRNLCGADIYLLQKFTTMELFTHLGENYFQPLNINWEQIQKLLPKCTQSCP